MDKRYKKDRNERIHDMRVNDGMSYRSIAEIYGITKERVRQIVIKEQRIRRARKRIDTQNSELLEYLRDHGSITPLEALSKLGIYRLSARIFDLRQDGHNIETNIIEEKDRRGRRCRVSVYTYLGRAA